MDEWQQLQSNAIQGRTGNKQENPVMFSFKLILNSFNIKHTGLASLLKACCYIYILTFENETTKRPSQGMSCEGACEHAHVRCAVARVRVRAK